MTNWKKAFSSSLRIAAALGAWGACRVEASDVSDSALSDEVVQKIDSELMKTYGRNIELLQNATQALGLTKPGETLEVRQLEADSDYEPTHKHYFNRLKDGSGVIIFFLQDTAANVIRGYRTDAGYHYVSGYVSSSTFVPLAGAEGEAALKAEIVWWNRKVSGTIYQDKGKAAEAKGAYAAALADFNQALEVDPGDSDDSYEDIARLLATCPDGAFRDGPKAVDYATKACKLNSWVDASKVSALAAACAEAGQFDDAVKWENQYLQYPKLSEADKQTAVKRLELYKAHQAFHAGK